MNAEKIRWCWNKVQILQKSLREATGKEVDISMTFGEGSASCKSIVEIMNPITEIVSLKTQVQKEKIFSSSRKRHVCKARNIIAHIAYKYNKSITNEKIGNYFYRDHATGRHMLVNFNNDYETNAEFKYIADDCKKEYELLIKNK